MDHPKTDKGSFDEWYKDLPMKQKAISERLNGYQSNVHLKTKIEFYKLLEIIKRTNRMHSIEQEIEDYIREKNEQLEFEIKHKIEVMRKAKPSDNLDVLKTNKFTHLFVLIPKSCRKEAIADIQEIISDMRQEGCNRHYIMFVVFLNLISVVYHGLFFKLKGYFYPTTEQSKNN